MLMMMMVIIYKDGHEDKEDENLLTFEVPRFEFVEIDFSNDIKVNGLVCYLLP